MKNQSDVEVREFELKLRVRQAHRTQRLQVVGPIYARLREQLSDMDHGEVAQRAVAEADGLITAVYLCPVPV